MLLHRAAFRGRFRTGYRRSDAVCSTSPRARSVLAVRAREGGVEGGEGGVVDDKPPSRRRVVSLSLSLSLASAASPLLAALPAEASTVRALDGVWYSLTGAPPDLYFPAGPFEGEFDAVSELVSAEAPLGEGALPAESLAGLRRAREEDLGRRLRYRTRFVRAPANPAAPPNAAVFDRAFNTLSLLRATSPAAASGAEVEWNVGDPNLLVLGFRGEEEGEGGGAGGEDDDGSDGDGGGDDGAPRGRRSGGAKRRKERRGGVRVRVTKRSEELVGDDRLDTSEFVQTIFLNDDGDSGVPRVKASQVFSKWKWRDETAELSAAGAPSIIATQVVSEFLGGPEAGNEGAFLAASGRPVAIYTYRLALTRVPPV